MFLGLTHFSREQRSLFPTSPLWNLCCSCPIHRALGAVPINDKSQNCKGLSVQLCNSYAFLISEHTIACIIIHLPHLNFNLRTMGAIKDISMACSHSHEGFWYVVWEPQEASPRRCDNSSPDRFPVKFGVSTEPN